MSNYTRPGDPDHVDKPEEWLNSALIFARTISLILEDNTGIVVKLEGDMKNPVGTSDHVVVFRKGDKIFIDSATSEMEEGDSCQIIDPNLN